MASQATIENALHRLRRCVPLLDVIRGDNGLTDEEIWDLTYFETDIPVGSVKVGTASYIMFCGPDVTPVAVYRNGYRFEAPR